MHITQVNDIKQMWEIMYENNISIDDNISELYWKTCSWPPKLDEEVKRATKRLAESRSQIISQISLDQEHAVSSITAYFNELDQFEGISNLSMTFNVYDNVKSLRLRIDRVFALIESISTREILISDVKFSLPMATVLLQNFESYENMWKTVDDMTNTMERWIESYFMDLNSDEMMEKMETWRSVLRKVLPEFAGSKHNSEAIVLKMKAKLDDFSRYTNVLIALLNPALREKHWSQISSIVGISLSDVQGLRLRDVMELDLELVQDIVGDISKDASSDFVLDASLESMKHELSSHEFFIKEFKSEICTIENLKDCLAMCEDHLMKSEALLASARSNALIVRIKTWTKKLFKTQEILEAWSYLQTLFVDIYPVTELPDFEYKLEPSEVENFHAVKKLMVMLSDILVKNRKFVTVVLRSDLYDLFLSAQSRIDRLVCISRKMLDHLRLKFNRFYLLNYDEITDVLGGSSDVSKIHRHLPKLFDNIHRLIKFAPKRSNKAFVTHTAEEDVNGQDEGVGGDQSLDVGSSFNRERRRSSRFSMISKRDNLKNRFFLKPDEKKDDGLGSVYGFSSLEGERIQLIESVKVTSRAEDWLQQLSDRIKSTIKWHAVEHMREVSNLLDASHHVGKVSFQTSYLVLNLIFTRQVTAILFGTPETLWKDMRKQITKAIEGLVSRLKTISYAAHRSSLENGIILFSEFQNIGDNLLNTEPNFGTQMEWLSLLRYYFESDIITVKCANYFAKYEFEYAGSGVRIMMSQSVNKHYNHIIESLSQSQSCAIIGQDPANKMDFLSEMAKWFGRKSHAINCALRIEEAHLANILYGSLSIGAWVCFENCHNLALEELSILSQHVSTIQRQILMAHKARRPVLTFEGVEFMVDSACTLFLSMDISHTQWENLSSSFKSSFRPVTFTMPDVGVLAETLLYANGFSSCSRMSKKLSILIKCITPLVDHSIRVEVGMKLIEQILHNASHTLRGVGGGGGDSHDYQTTEFLKVSWGVEKTISPLLSPRDVPYLRNILHDVFGYHQVSAELKAHPMLSFVQAAAHSLNLSAHDQFISKVIEIYDGIVSNQVVVIVGKSMSGKSSLLKTLEAALNLKANGQTAFHVFKCFPNMLRKMENVFGYHKEEVWIDGVLTDSLKAANRQAEEIIDELEAHKGSQDFYSCLLVEGRLKRELLERMLNGTEKVSGASLNFGETLLLSPRTKLVFETSDVKAWSPVQLARCNIIYVPDTIVKSCHFLPNVLQELPYVLQKHSEFYQHLHSLIFVQLSNFVKTNCRSNLMVCENAATQQVFRMVSSLHLDLGDLGYERLMDFEQYHWILASFLFASIWVVGALTDYQERVVVSDFIRSNVSTKVVREVEKKMGLSASLLTPCVQFPANDTVYEYFFDNKILSWEPWFMLAASDELPDTAGLPVKTDDIIRLKYFTRIMQSQNIPVLITGKLGVGKTITAFQSMLESDEVHGLPVRICLNDSSGGANFSDEIEKSLIKKRNKTLGLMERKNVVALVDDLDSDSFTRFPEQWETWRSWCENSGWYIRNKFTSVENLKLIVIMNHSQRAEDGVKHDRYLRYFWNFAIADDIGNKLSSICKTWIFDTNLESCLTLNGFGLKLVQAASYLNDRVCRMFVKSTSKPHYVFSLKEMTAAIRPLLTERALDSIQILGIWAYNCTRMYIDRLSEETERSRFEEILQDAIKNHFDVHLERIFPMERPLMLGNFGKELIPTNKSPELYPGLYFKSFKETLEVLSKNVTLIVDKQYLTYAQVEEILHHDAFVTAMRIESALQMNSSATLFGIDYEDR